MFAPSHETSNAVLQWLEANGIHPSRTEHSKGRNWIQFDATVAEAEKLLHTEYHAFEHEDGGFRLACDDYHLPKGVQQHVDFVMPTIQLDGLRPVAQKAKLVETDVVNITGLFGLGRCELTFNH